MKISLITLGYAAACLAAAGAAGTAATAGSGKANEPAPAKVDGDISKQIAATKPVLNFGGVGAEVALAGGQVFKVKKQLTRDVLKQRDGETIFVQITGPIYQGKTLEGAKKLANGQPEMAPARLCEIADLKTGRLHLLIANKVLEGALLEAFPDDQPGMVKVVVDEAGTVKEIPTPGYLGKSVAVTMHPAPEGKRYKTFEVFELEAA